MRIHHIINSYSLNAGGAERLVRDLHAGLRERGIESYILGLTAHQDHELEDARSLGLDSPYQMAKALLGIRAYAAEYILPGDLIHVHLFPASLYLSLLKILGVITEPLLFTEHSTSNRRRGTFFGRALDVLTYAGYEQVVAISQGVKGELLQWRPYLRKKTKVIYNGVSLHFTQNICRGQRDTLRVLSVGNLRPAKNYPNALKAIALLPDMDFEYLIAGGEGQCTEELKKLSQDLGLSRKVHFLGYVEDTHDALLKADVFLMPSLWEGFGLSAIEAMNTSLPIVASDVPGLREIVDCDPPCALLVNPHSPPSIAEGLRQLLLSPDLRLRLGKNAFHRAQKFSQKRMLEEHLNLYAEFIQS